MSTTDQVQEPSKYSEKWQKRFAFFDAYGAPSEPGYRAALKSLAFKQKATINLNFIAFFFGPIYLFVLGLWKKNLTLIAIIVAINVALEILYSYVNISFAKHLDFGVGFAINLLYAMTTNYAYYLKEQKGEQGWNPFKGMRW
ncbi:DUF2628 domain-containing protein [Pseudomonas sp. UM16]|uniref:DUF2628 domain-containing protein n=1 Tax=Pseudomonas sp. UM16 TaxID=3158962 RepID=UPI0039900B73